MEAKSTKTNSHNADSAGVDSPKSLDKELSRLRLKWGAKILAGGALYGAGMAGVLNADNILTEHASWNRTALYLMFAAIASTGMILAVDNRKNRLRAAELNRQIRTVNPNLPDPRAMEKD